MKKESCNVIDLTKAPYTTYGVGVGKGNPRKCFRCGQPIRRGESWRKETSADDSQHGRYSVIVHSPTCPDDGAVTAFQKMLKAA